MKKLSPLADLQWIEQTKGGCGIACLAIILGVTYNRIRELAPDLCEHCGVEQETLDHLLAEHGYAVQRFEQFRAWDGTQRRPWPPKPWADKHIAVVLQTATDHDCHHVVVDAKGYVLDPADSAFRKIRLSRYHQVLSVAAVIASEPNEAVR